MPPQSDLESCFHDRLVETRERPSCVSRWKLRCGQVPSLKKKTHRNLHLCIISEKKTTFTFWLRFQCTKNGRSRSVCRSVDRQNPWKFCKICPWSTFRYESLWWETAVSCPRRKILSAQVAIPRNLEPIGMIHPSVEWLLSLLLLTNYYDYYDYYLIIFLTIISYLEASWNDADVSHVKNNQIRLLFTLDQDLHVAIRSKIAFLQVRQ